MIFHLNSNDIVFPSASLAEEDGLLAIGGDLSPERLLLAYQSGIFPWYSDDEPICWFAPHERCVIFPENIFISKSMQKITDRNVFTVTTNTAFKEVIRNCKQTIRKEVNGTWITDEMETAYSKLHSLGIAHSAEVWQNDELIGGLYGIKINDVFCGESMFSKVSNASKAALIWLCTENNYTMIDCQLPNPHLMSMGAEMISREKYLGILNTAHGNVEKT